MSVSRVDFSLEDAIAHLLISNGVSLTRAIRGKDIFQTMSSGLSWTVSTTECKFAEAEIVKTCEKLAKAKRWPSKVLKEVENIASVQEEGMYVCSGGCAQSKDDGLLVYLTVAYKQHEKINLLVVTSDQNVTLAPEIWEKVITTIEPIMTTGKYKINAGPIHYEFSTRKQVGENVVTRIEVEKRERTLTSSDLVALQDFCLAKVCQKFLGQPRCHEFRGPEEIRLILNYNFDETPQHVNSGASHTQFESVNPVDQTSGEKKGFFWKK